MSNVMLSYITPEDNVSETFARYLQMVSETLGALGIDAHPSGHNDIMLGDRKVSGNAIYHIPGRVIAHGTLLYDTDMENMLHAITPSHTKLSKHGVESVRQRICLLKDYTNLPLEEIKQRIRQRPLRLPDHHPHRGRPARRKRHRERIPQSGFHRTAAQRSLSFGLNINIFAHISIIISLYKYI